MAVTSVAIDGVAVGRLVRQQRAAWQPSYLYVFDHCYDAAWVRKLCAFHASELPFVFGMAGRVMDGAPNWPAALGAEDRRLAHQMTDYWTSFAAQGIPSAPGAPAWAPYGAAETFMRFGDVPGLLPDPFSGTFEFHE